MSEPGSKPYVISKQVVVAAFEKVRSKKGAAGGDGVTVEQFAQDVRNNLYKLWNRMSSGSCFPAPVRLVEPVFHPDSYGYRPGRSPLDAVAACRQRCLRYAWAIDLDIQGFFDNLDHDLVLKAVAHHTDVRWILLYVARWLRAPMRQPDGSLTARDRGGAQGASISPLIANLFMHHAFDAWMAREFPHVPFERFVDDVIVHCVSEQQARRVMDAIASRLAECGGLRLHPDKTRIVYCKTSERHGRHGQVSFDVLGVHVQAEIGRPQGRWGAVVTTFAPAISGKAARSIRQEIRRMGFHLRSDLSFNDIAKMINVKAGPWAAYYGRFRPSQTAYVLFHIDRYLVRWARRKYKHLRRAPRRAWRTLAKIRKTRPGLLAHWRWDVRTRTAAARAG